MARSGNFGRLPRSAPDLTGTIVQLMREYNAMVDSNYVDAWQNGGKVDGKAVTDSRLLQHFRARRDALGRRDPLWTQWNNRITQYNFAIEDSKMQVKYDNGRASDMEMSRFYQRWADKTPNNTEFDRTLLSAVGKFRAAAAAKGRAAAAQAGVDKFKADIRQITNNGIKQAEDTNSALIQFAMDTGMLTAHDTTPDMSDILIGTGGVDRMWDFIQDGIENNTTDPNMPTYVARLEKALADAIPGFTWENGQELIDQTLEKGAAASQKAVRYVKGSKYGSDDWITHFSNRKATIEYAQTKVRNIGPEADLKANNDALMEALEAAHGNPFAESQAFDAYFVKQNQIAVTLVANQEGDIQDPVVTGINNERANYENALAGQTNVDMPDDWGSPQSGAVLRDYALSTGTAMTELQGGGWLELAPSADHPGEVEYVVVPANVPKPANAIMLPGQSVTDPTTGAVIPVYGTPMPVSVSTVDPSGSGVSLPALRYENGQPVPVMDPNTGKQAVDSRGQPVYEPAQDPGVEVIPSIDSAGKQFFLYRVKAPDGSFVVTDEYPSIPGVRAEVRMAGGGVTIQLTVDPTMVDPRTGQPPLPTGAPGAPGSAPTTTPSPFDTTKMSREDTLTLGHLRQDLVDARYEELGISKDPRGGERPPLNPSDIAAIDEKLVTTFRTATGRDIPLRTGAVPGTVPAGTPTTATGGPTTGPSFAGQEGLVPNYGPGFDPRQYIDQSGVVPNPETGQLNANYYRSVYAATLGHELNALSATDPDYQAKLAVINDKVANGGLYLKGIMDTATANGDTFAAQDAFSQFQLWEQNDKNALTVAVTGAQSGQPGAASMTGATNPINIILGALSGITTLDSRVETFRSEDEGFEAKLFARQRAVLGDRTLEPFTTEDGTGFTPAGTPQRPGQNPLMDPRGIKLPDIGAAVPILKPLIDFAQGAQVPQLGQPVPAASSIAKANMAEGIAPPTTIGGPTGPKPPDIKTPKPPKPPEPPKAPTSPPPVDYSGTTKQRELEKLL